MRVRSICWTTVVASVWAACLPAARTAEVSSPHNSFPRAELRISSSLDPGGGLLGEYFDDYWCHGVPVLTRIDPQISFIWAEDRFGLPMSGRSLSIRWSGYLKPLYTETYTLIARAPYVMELSIANKQVEWTFSGSEVQGKVELVGGETHSIEIVYEGVYEGNTIQLLWESPCQTREIIPPSALQPPLRTSHPLPADGATEVPQDMTVHWTMGGRATHHDIYLGVDANAVAQATTATAGIYRGRQTRDAITFTPGPLEWDTTYWWRIDEVNDVHPESPWKGPVWQFTTANFLLIDDFESYDEEDNRIYETWIDGWGAGDDKPGNGTGGIVGYTMSDQLPVVHSGRESMPFEYNNDSAPYYSEASRTWNTAHDWTVRKLTHLSLWVRGQFAPLLVKPDGNIVIGVRGGYAVSTPRFAYRQAIGDCEITAKVEELNCGENAAAAGVMVRETQDANSRYAAVGITPSNGIVFERRFAKGASVVQDRQDDIRPPQWVKLIRKGDVFTAQHSADGVDWRQIVNVQHEPIVASVVMGQTVYIGLYMIGRTGEGGGTAEFSDVAFTGNVSGRWQVTDPEYGNSPDSLYIALEDAVGRIGKTVHPTIVATIEWTQWTIPLSDFADAGVDLAAVKRMYVGVGDRDCPQPDGKGMIHIDDIRVIQSDTAPQQADDTTGTED